MELEVTAVVVEVVAGVVNVKGHVLNKEQEVAVIAVEVVAGVVNVKGHVLNN